MTAKRLKKSINWLVIAVLVLLAGSIAMISLRTGGGASGDVVWTVGEIKSEYAYNTVLDLSNAKVDINGTSVTAKPVLTYPSGKVLSADSVSLTEVGNYALEYKAMSNKQLYTKQYTFKATNSFYSILGETTSASYGRPQPTDLKEGLIVSLAPLETFTINEVIDLSKLTSSDSLIDFYINPLVKGKKDFMRLNITFTDADDSSNYINIRVRASEESDTYTYLQAGATGQITTGYEANFNRIHRGGIYGTAATNSFSGARTPIESDIISISYNVETKQLFVGGAEVIDFDNPNHFDSLWNGFVDGRVRVSFTAEEVTSQTANFVITDVYSLDLSKESLKDNDAPVITIDDAEQMLVGSPKVGCAYKIPSAIARDVQDGNVSVDVRVCENYDNLYARIEKSIVNGRFTPAKAAVYTIVYSAKDYSGNMSDKQFIVVTATDEASNIKLTASKITEKMYVGKKANLPTATVTGQEGSVSITYKVMYEDKSEIAVVNGAFAPLKSGKISVTYNVIDYIGQTASFSYDINVTLDESQPMFTYDADLLDKYLSGYTYNIPSLSAYRYSANGTVKEVPTKIYASIDGKQKEEIKNNSLYIETTNKSGSRIIFTYETEDFYTKTYNLEIVAANYRNTDNNALILQPDKYFNTSAKVQKILGENMVFSTSEDGWFEYIGNITSESFEFLLATVAKKSGMKSIDFYITDSVDSSLQIKASFSRNGADGTIDFAYNDGSVVNIAAASFDKVDKKEFSIGLEGNKIVAADVSMKISSFLNGEKFNGFPSGKCKVRGYFTGVTSDAAIAIEMVNNQVISSSTTRDVVAPQITMVGVMGGVKEVGEVFLTPKVFAFDVFSPNSTLTLTVKHNITKDAIKDINGLALVNVDGTKQYSVKLSDFGKYSFEYTAVDDGGKSGTRSFAITVPCREEPILKLDGKIATSVKLNKIVEVPRATATSYEGLMTEVRRLVVTPKALLLCWVKMIQHSKPI